MEPPQPFDLVMYDAISTYCATRPHNIPFEVLSHIMSFVHDKDLPACVYTNSSFYLAAKPHLYRTVVLDQYFHALGPEHPLVDLDVSPTPTTRRRPLFRRAWMTRVCHTLEVSAHHESFCACAVGHHSGPTPLIPHLPHLRTLHLPFDVHGTLRSRENATPCGVHALVPAHLIQHGVYWTSRQPATTTIAGLQSYTAHIAEHELWNADRRPLHLQLPGMARGARLTLVAPTPAVHCRVPPPCPSFRDLRCLTVFDAMSGRDRVASYPLSCRAQCPHRLLLKVARTVARFSDGPRVRLVGFEVACADRALPVYRHLAWLTRAFFDAHAQDAADEGKDEAAAWRARAGPVDAFHLIHGAWWLGSDFGRGAVSRAERLKDRWAGGWPRSVSRLARDRGVGFGVHKVKTGFTREEYWLPEPERDWVLVEE